ncbi:MAG: ADP compounds hydrolase NudE [Methylococcaceae bacterium]|nr:ADP compounds hydrolase NudE [Methylococcaceae bacterium]MCI0667224.1 ADP compounds hydrolase NudE [Methylococcaceae bacterium]MCI0733486.1 ADP compounds hydrolase NudE [Methylococcaceae bacterium]
MPEKPTILKRTTLAKTRLFRIESMHLRFSNGKQREFERLARSTRGAGAVLIVPVLSQDRVILVREYAAGVDRYEIGLPKGKTDPGEDILQAANRELKEEIGFGARRLTLLSSMTIAPGYLEHTTDIVLAEELYEEKLPGDEPEELEQITWDINKISDLVAGGECTEARTIAALYVSRDYLTSRAT